LLRRPPTVSPFQASWSCYRCYCIALPLRDIAARACEIPLPGSLVPPFAPDRGKTFLGHSNVPTHCGNAWLPCSGRKGTRIGLQFLALNGLCAAGRDCVGKPRLGVASRFWRTRDRRAVRVSAMGSIVFAGPGSLFYEVRYAASRTRRYACRGAWNRQSACGTGFVSSMRGCAMPTANEYRLQAKRCLELAGGAGEPHVRATMTELAREYTRRARQTERRERDLEALNDHSSVKAHYGL
jgi:hypothetical protein